MKIAIAGGSGFVGSSVCSALRKRGHQIHLITRGDLEQNTDQFRQSLGRCDWMVNCVGCTKPNSDAGRLVNTFFPMELYKRSRDIVTEGFLHVSSVAATGSISQPGQWIFEDSPENPDSDYGRTKLEGDKRLRDCSSSDKKVCILRPPVLYGAKAGGVFGLLRKSALVGLPLPFSNLQNRRSFMFIDNFSEAVIAAIFAKLEGTHITVDHEPLSPAEIYDMMTIAAGKGQRTFSLGTISEPLIKLALKNRASSLLNDACYSGEKFRQLTGYVPKYSQREAFEITMHRY
ncbi:MAG: NAD-dependent epimerase/dehydratase family protein [Parasphingorhabdus sp.]